MPNRKLIPILLLTFVNTLGFTILIPVLPFIIRQYDSTELVFGILLSAYSAFQFLAAPLLGSLSDYWGRKPVLLLTQAGTLASWIVFAGAYFIEADTVWMGMALSIWVIGLARVIDGATGGNVSVTNAYLADVIPKADKAGAFGLLGATFGVGIIIGPAIGGFTMASSLGYLGTALFAIALSTLTLLCIIFELPESLAKKDRSETFDSNLWHQINLWRKIRQWKDNQLVQTVIQLRVVFGLILASYTSIITLLIIDVFSLNETQLAWVLLVVGTFMIFNQSFLVKPVVKRLGEFATLLLSLALMSVGLFGMALMENLYAFLAIYYLTNLGVSLLMPTVLSMLSNEVSEKEQGEMTGVIEGVSAFSMAVAPILAAWGYGEMGVKVCFVFSGIMFMAWLWFWWGYRRCSQIKV